MHFTVLVWNRTYNKASIPVLSCILHCIPEVPNLEPRLPTAVTCSLRNFMLVSSLPVSLSFRCFVGSHPNQTTVLALHSWSHDQLLGKLNLKPLIYVLSKGRNLFYLKSAVMRSDFFPRKDVISVMKKV